jgi:hypothetical protein
MALHPPHAPRKVLPLDTFLKVYEAQGNARCCYCDAGEQPFHVEHFIPHAAGGPDEIWNFGIACAKCNLTKSDTDLLSWLEARPEIPEHTYQRMVWAWKRFCLSRKKRTQELRLINIAAKRNGPLAAPEIIDLTEVVAPEPRADALSPAFWPALRLAAIPIFAWLAFHLLTHPW